MPRQAGAASSRDEIAAVPVLSIIGRVRRDWNLRDRQGPGAAEGRPQSRTGPWFQRSMNQWGISRFPWHRHREALRGLVSMLIHLNGRFDSRRSASRSAGAGCIISEFRIGSGRPCRTSSIRSRRQRSPRLFRRADRRPQPLEPPSIPSPVPEQVPEPRKPVIHPTPQPEVPRR